MVEYWLGPSINGYGVIQGDIMFEFNIKHKKIFDYGHITNLWLAIRRSICYDSYH